MAMSGAKRTVPPCNWLGSAVRLAGRVPRSIVPFVPPAARPPTPPASADAARSRWRSSSPLLTLQTPTRRASIARSTDASPPTPIVVGPSTCPRSPSTCSRTWLLIVVAAHPRLAPSPSLSACRPTACVSKRAIEPPLAASQVRLPVAPSRLGAPIASLVRNGECDSQPRPPKSSVEASVLPGAACAATDDATCTRGAALRPPTIDCRAAPQLSPIALRSKC